MNPGATLVLVDPATVALHEVAEPARLRSLVRAMRNRQVQDAPALLTIEPHGLLVLDGVHRTHALMSLGIPRMLAVVLPRTQVDEPDGWTHHLDLPGGPEEVLRRMRTATGIVLHPHPSTAGERVVAQVLTGDQAWAVQATQGGQAGLAAAFHAVAHSYSGLPYRRLAVPPPPGPRHLQVRWVAPRLSEVESLVAAHGALPAGVTRFDLPPGPRTSVSFDDLRNGHEESAGRALLERLRIARDPGDQGPVATVP